MGTAMRFWIGITALVAAVLVAGCGACDEGRGDYYNEIPNAGGEKPNVDGTEQPSVPPAVQPKSSTQSMPAPKQQNY